MSKGGDSFNFSKEEIKVFLCEEYNGQFQNMWSTSCCGKPHLQLGSLIRLHLKRLEFKE